MAISAEDVVDIFRRVFRQEIDISLDVPILDSGLKLESLRMMRVLIEVQDLLGYELDLENAFELFNLSINEFVHKLNTNNSAEAA
jgi:hypothetical protein